jgi:AraC-like DNA-binding protein
MRDQIDQPLSLGSMARIALASPSHFNRTFRQVTGVPPLQFFYALRLERARRLLMQTRKKVIDICYDVGYNSVGTFTRRFTDLMGISPTTFRELAQSQPSQGSELPDAGATHAQRRKGARVSGRISAPAHFHGMIFVGLFETAIPQGKPLACAMPTEGGSYTIENAPEGEYYLFGLGLEHPIQAPDCLHYDGALRAGGHAIQISRDSVQGPTYLRLRPPSPFDPPILLVLPLLMEKFYREKQDQTIPAELLPAVARKVVGEAPAHVR